MEQRNHSPLPFKHIKTNIIKGYIHDGNQKLVGHIFNVEDRNFLLMAGNNYYDLTNALQSALCVISILSSLITRQQSRKKPMMKKSCTKTK